MSSLLQTARTNARRAISPLRPATNDEVSQHSGILYAQRLRTEGSLPAHFLVYFLLVEVLEFPYLGSDEKVAWTIPVSLDNTILAIQHRKLGLGIFALNPLEAASTAERAVALIRGAAKSASAYFDWKAQTAVETARLNVVNHNGALYGRFQYFREKYRSLLLEAERRSDESSENTIELGEGHTRTKYTFPSIELMQEAEHHGHASIDAFYAWTEHLFVHLAILIGTCRNGVEVAKLAGADWSEKYKAAVSIEDARNKHYFDQLVVLRRQFRNFTAHGSFGKNGRAFSFHSAAGAVPVLLGQTADGPRYSLVGDTVLSEGTAIQLIDEFLEYLWSGPLGPARTYLLESGLPLILTLVIDGSYAEAMRSGDNMRRLVDILAYQFDQAANMDW